jgi:hypothetical protein
MAALPALDWESDRHHEYARLSVKVGRSTNWARERQIPDGIRGKRDERTQSPYGVELSRKHKEERQRTDNEKHGDVVLLPRRDGPHSERAITFTTALHDG